MKKQLQQQARRAKRSAWHWSKALAVVWAAQFGVLLYFLVTQTWSTYWFCRDLYKPGYALFAWAGRGVLPAGWFDLFSMTGVLVSFAVAALLYSAVAIAAVSVVRQVVRK